MATPELLRTWKRTEIYLVEARALVSETELPELTIDLQQVDEFLEHNELGLACDWLVSIAKEKYWDSKTVLAALAFAEASMGRTDKRLVLEERLTQLHGEKYQTTLPEA